MKILLKLARFFIKDSILEILKKSGNAYSKS